MTALLARLALACLLLAAAAPRASAYNTCPFFLLDGTGYLKWADNYAGTPSSQSACLKLAAENLQRPGCFFLAISHDVNYDSRVAPGASPNPRDAPLSSGVSS